MELRSTDATNQINVHYGGVLNLCSRLKTNPVEGKDHSGGGAPEAGGECSKLVSRLLEKAVRALTGLSVSFAETMVSEAPKGGETMESHFFPSDGVPSWSYFLPFVCQCAERRGFISTLQVFVLDMLLSVNDQISYSGFSL